MPTTVRPTRSADRPWIREALESAWGGVAVVSRGRLTEDASLLPGLVAERDGRPAGYVLLRVEGDAAEVVALHSLQPGAGMGTALLDGAREEAARAGCRRVWLITTNDNLEAIGFYQRRGWDWVALHRDALEQSRALKPSIAATGAHGIPIRHELEFELRLDQSPGSPSQ